ncbi:hypothetical protein [Vibrio bivalvicida]|uniref:Lipopolysaccharide biosynthesis protein n=1 Tax=Vibrio bivalvicida TaxID=1276888 RepID=A0A177Y5W9_9VIBR|nr:hypothetical protein [Vibrio bivalvicida]OAJ96157.1 hypothetical protein APB76_01230 [Vibrio bivalvicida]
MCNSKHTNKLHHNDDNEFVDVKSVLSLIWKKKWWVILSATSIAFACGLYGLDKKEMSYESQATIVATSDPYGFYEDAGFDKGVWITSENPTLAHIINLPAFQQAMKTAVGFQDIDFSKFRVDIDSSTQVNISLRTVKSQGEADRLMKRYLNTLHEQLKLYEVKRVGTQLNVVQDVVDKAETPMERQAAYKLLVMRKIKLATLEHLALFEVKSVVESQNTKDNSQALSIAGGVFGMFFSIAIILLYSLFRRN